MTDSIWGNKPSSSGTSIDQSAAAGGATQLASIVKRLFDIIMSASALMVLAPVFVLVALLLKTYFRDVPIFYGGWVIGLNGAPFRMWKFSTMGANAHLTLKDILAGDPALQAEWEKNVKLQEDPRILPGIGNFLRRTSLNEIPQFYNVLVGEMSLVGPRPITKAEEALYNRIGGGHLLARRHAQRPGITGLWQATGRSNVSYEERVEIDGAYLRNQSFMLDLKILWWTARKVISGKGAV